MTHKYIIGLCFIIIFYLFYKQNNLKETMTDLNSNDMRNIVYNTYKIDVNSIKNLSEIATQLLKDGLTIPGNMTIKGNLDINGSGIWLGDKNKNQWLLNAVNNNDGNILLNRVQKNGSVNLNSGLSLLTSTDGTQNMGGSLNLMPQGMIVVWAGIKPPIGWVLCDGQYNTPDLRGRFILGYGHGDKLINREIGQTGGNETITLTNDHIPPHNHQFSSTYWPVHVGDLANPNRLMGGVNAPDKWNFNTSTTGNGLPHDNMPPYYVLAYIMKL